MDYYVEEYFRHGLHGTCQFIGPARRKLFPFCLLTIEVNWYRTRFDPQNVMV